MRFSMSVALLSLAASSCSPVPATQVLVWFDIEPGSSLEARAVGVRVRAYDADGVALLDEDRDLAALALPASVSLLPRDADVARPFRVEVTLLEDDGAGGRRELAKQTAEGAFSPETLIEVRLRFTEACAGVACSFGKTCVGGSCVRACFSPSAPGDMAPSEPAECACACTCEDDRCDGAACVPRVPIVAIAAGRAHACAIDVEGALYCWGDNSSGQLGAGDTETHETLVRVELAQPVRAVAAGWRHTCAIVADGALYCWGDNAARQLGVEGASSPSPARVVHADGTPLAEVSNVATGDKHTCAELGAGAVYCWGDNEFGQVGDGTAALSSRPPTRVVADETFQGAKEKLVAGFAHTCALLTIGRIWCWGRNQNGNLGTGDRVHRHAPTRLFLEDGTEPLWTDVAIGNGWHTCAIASETLYCFGDPGSGRLGLNVTVNVTWPTIVDVAPGLAAASVTAGVRHTCVPGTDGRVFCFGTGASGELGVGALEPAEHGPVELADADWEAFALGEAFSCGVRRGGALYCCGENAGRQLGVPDRNPRNVPVRVCIP